MNKVRKVSQEKLKTVVNLLSDSIHSLAVSLFYIEELPSKDTASYYVGAHLVAGSTVRDIKSYTEVDIDENSTTAYYPRVGVNFYVYKNQDDSYSVEPGSVKIALFPYSPVSFIKSGYASRLDIVPISDCKSILGENLGFEILEKLKRNEGMAKIERKLKEACKNIGQINTPLMSA